MTRAGCDQPGAAAESGRAGGLGSGLLDRCDLRSQVPSAASGTSGTQLGSGDSASLQGIFLTELIEVLRFGKQGNITFSRILDHIVFLKNYQCIHHNCLF